MKKKIVVKKKEVEKVEKINSAVSGKVMNETNIVGDGCLIKESE